MARTATNPVLQLIRRVVEDQRHKDLPDHELLRCFLSGCDKDAFDALLRRHGSMVLDVCRNVLGNEQDAEDAFQATFLILAQKAGTIRERASVGSWPYGVAYRAASKARTRTARRRKHEAGCPRRETTEASDDVSWREVQQLLHAQLNRLPERYRASLVYCYLEGKTQDEAARLLGVSRAAVQKRLESGRALLRTRLLRQGLGPAAVLAASAWPAAKASALVPCVLLDSTAKAAALIGAGEAVKGVTSPKVFTLTEGVLKAMFLTKLKVVSAVVSTVLVSTGLAGWSYRAAAQTNPFTQQTNNRYPATREERPARRADRPAADELDALRLEIDALRKEVRADRERIKALETEAYGRKEKGAGMNPLQQGRPETAFDLVYPDGSRNRAFLEGKIEAVEKSKGGAISLTETPADYFAEAEAALKRLRENPRDNQAAELLERASQRLKARAKGEGKSNRASNNPQRVK